MTAPTPVYRPGYTLSRRSRKFSSSLGFSLSSSSSSSSLSLSLSLSLCVGLEQVQLLYFYIRRVSRGQQRRIFEGVVPAPPRRNHSATNEREEGRKKSNFQRARAFLSTTFRREESIKRVVVSIERESALLQRRVQETTTHRNADSLRRRVERTIPGEHSQLLFYAPIRLDLFFLLTRLSAGGGRGERERERNDAPRGYSKREPGRGTEKKRKRIPARWLESKHPRLAQSSPELKFSPPKSMCVCVFAIERKGRRQTFRE